MGPLGVIVALPEVTTQLMVTPTAATPLFSAVTDSTAGKLVPTVVVWLSPLLTTRVGTDATVASKETLTSSPLAGMPSGS